MMRVVNTFKELKNNERLKIKYGISGKTFFSFIKEAPTSANDNEKRVDSNGSPIKSYNVRLYARYGMKISHAKYVGELSLDQIRGKRCNMDIELGSLWINPTTMMYGINVHIISIKVLN